MPTNPLPYQCGTPGCNRKFEKLEHLRQHTKDFHSPSRPPPKQLTFKCGVEGCKAPSFPQLSLLHQHTAEAHPKSNKNIPSGSSTLIPLPKPETFKCGVEGCKAPSFPQLSLLHQHTARDHPKSNKSTSSGSSTAFSEGPPIPVTKGYLPPPSGIANEAQYAPPYLYSPQPSASTSLATQKDISGPGQASVAFATSGKVLQRLRQLELRQMLIDKSALKVGMHFVELAEDIIRASTNDRRISFLDRLQERVKWMSKHNNVCSLAYSAKFRADVKMLLHDFGYSDNIKFEKAFLEDDQVISHLFREVIHSESGQEEILYLSDEKATGFMDVLHKCIMASDDTLFVLPARQLLTDLCAATKAFPPTLFLELDSVDTNRQIGRGGFADIFLGRYQGQDVALKRLQLYQPEPNEMSKISKSLLQEVLAWVHLKHPYVLPFFGLDKQFFEGYPPCIVTPYMRNGTMNNFVKNRNGTLPDRQVDQLLFETAQGLAYLHSQNIVHGDPRGGNVLIDDGEHAQLFDFGLAVVTDAISGTTTPDSPTQGGSSRWMAPELFDYRLEFKRTEASDVYAFACLCIEIYTGEQPFWSIQQEMAVILQVLAQQRPPRPSSSGPPDGTRAMSDGLWAIVEACWAHKPSDRPDMGKVSGLIMASLQVDHHKDAVRADEEAVQYHRRMAKTDPTAAKDLQLEDSIRSSEGTGAGTLNGNGAGGVEIGTFIIYSPHGYRTETAADSFTTNDLTYIQTNLGIGGCLMSIHEPVEAASWMEDNWDNPLLTSIRNSGCEGPLAWMLSPQEPALAIFGCYENPTVVDMAQSVADLSGFPVVIRPTCDNPALTLLTRDTEPQNGYVQFNSTGGNDERGCDSNEDVAMPDDERTPGETGNGGRRDNHLGDAESNGHSLNTVVEHGPNRDGGPQGGGDGGGGDGEPTMVDGKWESPLHRTRVELRLKLNTTHTYAVNIGYTFKFTINHETEIPIDLGDLTRPLSQSEVIALVDLKIETRPRETQIDRSYASIGFVSHRKKSIIDREFLHRGFDLPDKLYTRTQQRQTQRGLEASLGFSQASPLATTTFSYNQNNDAMLEATDNKVMPRCRVDYEIGEKWDKDNKSYSSYNIDYQAQDIRLDAERLEFHPLEVKVGMGINLRPAGSEKPLPQLSFVNRNQVLIWVSDPTSKSRIRGIVVLMSSYLDNIRTEPKLSIYEQEEIGLGARSLNTSKIKTEEHEPGTISLSIAQVENQAAPGPKSRTWVPAFVTKFSQRSSVIPLADIPPHEYLARGWDANNNEWRSVLWPALDKHFRAADLERTPPVCKIQCPWKKTL